MKCPLCKSKQHRFIVELAKDNLIKKYNKFLNEDFTYLINSDIQYYECLTCKLRFFYPLITGDEKFYKSLHQFHWYYMDEKDEYNVAKQYINDNDSVIEIGCGRGAFKQHIPHNDYIGLDFSINAKKIAKKHNITIKNKTVEEFSKKNKHKFDIAISFQVLEHVSDPESFLKSKLDLLKPGGKLIISVPSEDSFIKFVTDGLLNMPPHHVTRWPTSTLKYIAKKYNLKIIDIIHEELQDVHKIHYMQTLVRNSLSISSMLSKDNIDEDFINSLARSLTKGLKKEMLPKGQAITIIYEK